MAVFNTGKIPSELLERMIHTMNIQDRRVIVGPRIGEDAAVLDMGDRYLVVTTDPVTFTEERIGWYCVNINANDVAAMGAKPSWFLVTLLMPAMRTDEQLVSMIFDDILQSCQELGVTLCGGHTEITVDLNRPIAVGMMMGEVKKEKLVMSSLMVPGDVILLTQGIAVEGTAILAAEKEDVLSGQMDAHLLSNAKRFLNDPGISVVAAALAANESAPIHGMHDPTEGGLATGLWELARSGGNSLRINGDAVPVFAETQEICRILNLNPWGLISSGALLIVTDPESAEHVIHTLSYKKIPCMQIGEIIPNTENTTISFGSEMVPLKPFERDEITRII